MEKNDYEAVVSFDEAHADYVLIIKQYGRITVRTHRFEKLGEAVEFGDQYVSSMKRVIDFYVGSHTGPEDLVMQYGQERIRLDRHIEKIEETIRRWRMRHDG